MPGPRLGSQVGGGGMSLQEPRDQHRSRKQTCMSILCRDSHEVTPASAWGCHLAMFTGKLNLGYFSPLAEGCPEPRGGGAVSWQALRAACWGDGGHTKVRMWDKVINRHGQGCKGASGAAPTTAETFK